MSPVESAAAVLGDVAHRDVLLGARTTYRAGGRAALLFEATSEGDLARAAEAVAVSKVPVLVVGRGSNLLISDRGFAGLALVLGDAFAEMEISGTYVRAGGRLSLPVLARRTAAAGLRGLEWAVGVPGSVGGAVRMNAGGHGSETAATIVGARILDLTAGASGAARDVDVGELGLGYRRSDLSPGQVVLAADFELRTGSAEEAEREIDDVVQWRRRHQPGGANAGSVFANPPGDSAGRLIEAAGLKGRRRGSASVSTKHANFFQCDEGGSAEDVFDLINEVRTVVEDRFGVRLETEVQLVGFKLSTIEVK
ncbi:MAG: UDP-N-acetylmuramate dehydrogenase [Acidimicrobiales bacterium]